MNIREEEKRGRRKREGIEKGHHRKGNYKALMGDDGGAMMISVKERLECDKLRVESRD